MKKGITSPKKIFVAKPTLVPTFFEIYYKEGNKKFGTFDAKQDLISITGNDLCNSIFVMYDFMNLIKNL